MRPVYAHRYSWIIHRGPIQSGMEICHRCDNPSCVNPDHLFLGTRKDNIHDMIRKGRKKGTKLTLDQVREIIRRNDENTAKLAVEFKVSTVTIYRIKSGRQWNSIRVAE